MHSSYYIIIKYIEFELIHYVINVFHPLKFLMNLIMFLWNVLLVQSINFSLFKKNIL